MSYPGKCFNFLIDAVFVCPLRQFVVCELVLPFNFIYLVILSCHLILRMYLRHLFMNVSSFVVLVLVTLHVSEPYSDTFFSLVLKIRILLLIEKDGVFRFAFKVMKAFLFFPILLLTFTYIRSLSVTTQCVNV